MSIRICIFAAALFAISAFGLAAGPVPAAEREPRRAPHEADTLIPRASERNQRLYDSIRTKTSRRTVPRLMYSMLFRPVRDTTGQGRVLDADRLFEPYAGRIIGRVEIVREPVFGDNNWFERAGNKTHVMTRERVIRRDLLFRAGDALDPQLLVRNAQLLRSRRYISDAEIIVAPDPLDSARVDIVVRTRDSWTITVDGALHGEGRTMVGLYDANILGWGNSLRVKTHFDRRNFDYGGNIVEYEIPNVLGTFFTADFTAGRDFYNSELVLGVRKEFIRRTDYAAGVDYSEIKAKHYLIDRDTSELAKSRTLDVWGGRSRYFRGIRSSFFVTGRYHRVRYSLRPEVGPRHNTAFHDADELLFGTGLYREKFYTANMIYGYGTREYLASGYKAELTGGYSWGEFGERMYLGTGYTIGDFTRIGYLSGGFSLGSYIDLSTGGWSGSAVDLDMRWISNLLLSGRTRIRQFLSLNYTQGWNRGTGNNESLRFTDENGLQMLREYVTGTNRMVLNTETVFFTPYQPLGFRIALFGFADFGLLGDVANPFRNAFFTSFGLGVRIKNERLIFNAVQIQLGVALGKPGLADSRYFQVSNQTRIDRIRYRPTQPEIVGFE